MSEETLIKRPATRPVRVPLGTRDVLTAPKRPGYIRRFVNEGGGRVEKFEAAGYEVVREDIKVGDPKAGKGNKIGSAVNPSVGGGSTAILMETKQEYYDEDQKAKQDRILRGERDMKRELNSGANGTYGETKIGTH